MSKFTNPLCTIAIAALVCVGYAQAQQSTILDQQEDAFQTRNEATRSGTQQQNYGADHSKSWKSHGQGVTVKEALVRKLIKANEAEIELAKMAMDKVDDKELKEFTKMIVEDHQKCNKKLEEMTTGMSKKQSTAHNDDTQERLTADSQTAFEEQSTRLGQSGQAEQQASYNQEVGSRQQAAGQQMVPESLCKVAEQACDNALKMTKNMLSKYDGQDFEMAFLGQQCVAHTMMLAELKAIASDGPQELQSMAKETSQKIEQHLEKAKKLAKKLEDDRENA